MPKVYDLPKTAQRERNCQRIAYVLGVHHFEGQHTIFEKNSVELLE